MDVSVDPSTFPSLCGIFVCRDNQRYWIFLLTIRMSRALTGAMRGEPASWSKWNDRSIITVRQSCGIVLRCERVGCVVVSRANPQQMSTMRTPCVCARCVVYLPRSEYDLLTGGGDTSVKLWTVITASAEQISSQGGTAPTGRSGVRLQVNCPREQPVQQVMFTPFGKVRCRVGCSFREIHSLPILRCRVLYGSHAFHA